MTNTGRRKKLYLLECKAAFVCMGKAMIMMAATISLAAFFLWLSFRTDTEDGILGRIEIGVVSMDTSNEMETITTYLESMPVLKALCRLQLLEKEEAMRRLKEGDLQMVIQIPEHFLKDAVYMKETTLEVCVPSDMTPEIQRVLSLLQGIERIMLTTESAIMSMYEGMRIDTYEMSVGEMEGSLTNLYVDRFFNRSGYYREEYLSPYGEYTPLQYYGVSLVLLLTTLFSVFFFGLYDLETVRLEKLLGPANSGMLRISLVKILCMGLPVVLWIWMVLGAVNVLFDALALPGFYITGASVPAGLLIGIAIAGCVQLFVSIFGNGIRQQIAFVLLILLLWLCGGILGSAYYLPHFMRAVSNFDPAVIWVMGMLSSLFSETDAVSFAPLVITTLLSTALGVFCYMKHMQRSR